MDTSKHTISKHVANVLHRSSLGNMMTFVTCSAFDSVTDLKHLIKMVDFGLLVLLQWDFMFFKL